MKIAQVFPVVSAIGRLVSRAALRAGAVAAVLLLAPLPAQAAPGPDLKLVKGCQLDASKGPTAVVCTINVWNMGTVASVSPVTITETPTGPAGTTFLQQQGSSFPCSPASGVLPRGAFTCGAPYALAIGGPTAGGSSGSTFLTFVLPKTGGVLRNCASVTQGQNAATPKDPDMSNNSSCTSITVPGVASVPDVSISKTCKTGANSSVTCWIVITNHGPGAAVAPVRLTDTLSPLTGVFYTGASGNVSCGGAGPLTAPVSCTLTQPIPAGQSATVLLSFTIKGRGGYSQCATVKQGGAVAETNTTNNSVCVKLPMP